MHLRKPSPGLVKELHAQQRVQRKMFPSERDKERALELGLPIPTGETNGSSHIVAGPASSDDRRRPREDDVDDGRRQRRRAE
jgi:splicing factor U2AF subunit